MLDEGGAPNVCSPTLSERVTAINEFCPSTVTVTPRTRCETGWVYSGTFSRPDTFEILECGGLTLLYGG